MKYIFFLFGMLLMISFQAYGEKTCLSSHIVKSGDTLSKVAYDYLGVPIWGEGGALEKILKCNDNIQNPDLIYPGTRVLISKNFVESIEGEVKEADVSQKDDFVDEKGKETSVENEGVSQKETPIENEGVDQKETLEKKYQGKRHGLAIEVSSFHSELSGLQTSGAGTGSRADEILSDPSFSAYFRYNYYLSKNLAVKIGLGLKNYIFSKDLDSKVIEKQSHLALNPTLGFIYVPFSFLNLNLDILSFEQNYYASNGLGNFIFDYERVWRLELNPAVTLLRKRLFNLGIGAIGSYHLKRDLVSSAFGFGGEVFVDAFFNKSLTFKAKYYDLTYAFVSSEIRNELLELGLGYKWEF